MKVYDKRKEFHYDYPDDMEKILKYLRANGDLHVSGETVERLYEEFLDQYCASWLSVDDELLEEFAEWLDDYEL